MKLRTQKWLQLVPLEILITAIVFLLALFTFSLIVHEAVYEREDVFDSSVIRFFAAHSSRQFIAAMKSITFMGSTSFLLPAYLVLILWLLFVRKPQQAFDIAVVAISSTAMMFALKEFFKRQRPALPIIKNVSGYSFPSGHSLSSFIFCTVLIYLVWNGRWPKPLKAVVIVLLVLLALTIGLSRVVLNVHYATDVIGGLCLGMIWAIISFFLIKRLRKKAIPASTAPDRQ